MRSDLAALVSADVLTEDAAAFLQRAVHSRLNIVVSGREGTGKTSLLNALVHEVDGSTDNVATIENALELDCDHLSGCLQGVAGAPDAHGAGALPTLNAFTYNAAGLDQAMAIVYGHGAAARSAPDAVALGTAELTTRDLVRSAVRLRPGRVIVGDVGGSEALDLLCLMRAGFDGSMCAIRSDSVHDTFDRLHDCAMQSGEDVSATIHMMIGEAVQIVVHLRQEPGGKEGVVESIFEVTGWDRAGDVDAAAGANLWYRDIGGDLVFQGRPSSHLPARA